MSGFDGISGFGGLQSLGAQALRPVAQSRLAATEWQRTTAFDRTLSGLSFDPPTAQGDTNKELAGASLILSIFGSTAQAVGSFYAAQNQQTQLKSQASSEEFAATTSGINARNAAEDANAIIEAGQSEVANLSLQYGQLKAAAKTAEGASGFTVGEGSSAERLASIELAKRLDMATTNRNAVRAAWQRRMQATDQRNQGALQRVSATNLRGTAGSIRPGAAASSSLLSSSGALLGQYASYRTRY